jgi:RNA polymerase sigma-70 factor (ECF subfamily)
MAAQVDLDNWYRRFGEAVYRRCLRLCRNPAQARDLMQEVFLRAHRYSGSYRGDASPMGWLFTIADRCFLDSVRKKEPVPAEDVEAFIKEEQEGADVVFSRHDLVARLLARSPRDVRQIVIHRYFDEMSHDQIASALSINERSVRRKLEKFFLNARKFLRRS